MLSRNFRDIKPEGHIDAREFNRMAEAVEQLHKISSSGSLQVEQSAGGVTYFDAQFQPFWARINGGTNPYSWSEVVDNGDGTYSDYPAGRSGTITALPAWDVQAAPSPFSGFPFPEVNYRTTDIVLLLPSLDWQSFFIINGAQEARFGNYTAGQSLADVVINENLIGTYQLLTAPIKAIYASKAKGLFFRLLPIASTRSYQIVLDADFAARSKAGVVHPFAQDFGTGEKSIGRIVVWSFFNGDQRGFVRLSSTSNSAGGLDKFTIQGFFPTSSSSDSLASPAGSKAIFQPAAFNLGMELLIYSVNASTYRSGTAIGQSGTMKDGSVVTAGLITSIDAGPGVGGTSGGDDGTWS